MAALIVSHLFTALCSRNHLYDHRGLATSPCIECSEWHGGAKCQTVLSDGSTCNRPRYEHEESNASPDYRYSSWSMSTAIREQITLALEAMREARKEETRYTNSGDFTKADLFTHRADFERSTLIMLFSLHHAGLGTTGSLQPTLNRRLSRIVDSFLNQQ